MKKFILYLIRWQLSTPVLAVCIFCLATLGEWPATIISSLIGGCMFFLVDEWIFKEDNGKNEETNK